MFKTFLLLSRCVVWCLFVLRHVCFDAHAHKKKRQRCRETPKGADAAFFPSAFCVMVSPYMIDASPTSFFFSLQRAALKSLCYLAIPAPPLPFQPSHLHRRTRTSPRMLSSYISRAHVSKQSPNGIGELKMSCTLARQILPQLVHAYE